MLQLLTPWAQLSRACCRPTSWLCVQERKVAADSLSGLAGDIRAAMPLLARHSSGGQSQPQPLDSLRQALNAASDVRHLACTKSSDCPPSPV